jgi:hypothetical protein
MKTDVCGLQKTVASKGSHSYNYFLQVGDTTQAPVSAAMPILPLLTSSGFDPESIETLRSAFETAWYVLERSGSVLVAGDKALVTHEALAERIVAMGRTGERNRERLVNAALVHVANSEMVSRRSGKVPVNGNAWCSTQPEIPSNGCLAF